MDRITALLVDDDVSSSVVYITDDTLGLNMPVEPIEFTDAPPNTHSAVLSLDQDTTEANLILEGITGRRLPSSLPAPLIQQTLINEASRREYILLLTFLTLYLTGQADLNTPWLREVLLKDYARYLIS